MTGTELAQRMAEADHHHAEERRRALQAAQDERDLLVARLNPDERAAVTPPEPTPYEKFGGVHKCTPTSKP